MSEKNKLNGRRIIKPCDAVAIANVLGVEMNDLSARTGRGEGND